MIENANMTRATYDSDALLDPVLFELEQRMQSPVRTVFIGLASQEDKHGVVLWEPLELDRKILPHDSHSVEPIMLALVANGLLCMFAYRLTSTDLAPGMNLRVVSSMKSLLPPDVVHACYPTGYQVGNPKGKLGPVPKPPRSPKKPIAKVPYDDLASQRALAPGKYIYLSAANTLQQPTSRRPGRHKPPRNIHRITGDLLSRGRDLGVNSLLARIVLDETGADPTEIVNESAAQPEPEPLPPQVPDHLTPPPPRPDREGPIVGRKGEDDVELTPEQEQRFLLFWTAFNWKKHRSEAAYEWTKLEEHESQFDAVVGGTMQLGIEQQMPCILHAATLEASWRRSMQNRGQAAKHADGWLKLRRFEDEDYEVPAGTPYGAK